jgi:hypothetical protein
MDDPAGYSPDSQQDAGESASSPLPTSMPCQEEVLGEGLTKYHSYHFILSFVVFK